MAEKRPERGVSVSAQVAFPLAAALALATILRGLYPSRGVDSWLSRVTLDIWIPPASVEAWLLDPAVIAGVCLAGQLWYVSRRLVPATAVGRPLVGLFGVANTLTLFRGALYAVVAGFVVVPPETRLAWVPAVAYGGGVVLDKLDGIVARTVGQETPLGRRLDMAFDTFGFVVAPLVAVMWGQLPVWYLSLSAARYVYRGGIAWRRYRGRPLYDPPDSDLGKYLAGGQMVFLTAALAPAVPTAVVWTVAPVALAASLSVFARDFLVVSGRLSHEED